MDIKRRNPDLETVFDQRWKANNYNQNGMKQKIEQRNNHFNNMFKIKPKDEHRKEILEANSVNGQVSRLEEKMKAAGAFVNNNNNKFR